jgi:hypothetical protein
MWQMVKDAMDILRNSSRVIASRQEDLTNQERLQVIKTINDDACMCLFCLIGSQIIVQYRCQFGSQHLDGKVEQSKKNLWLFKPLGRKFFVSNQLGKHSFSLAHDHYILIF